MYSLNKLCTYFIALTSVAVIFFACKTSKPAPETAADSPGKDRLLVFTKTKGYFHESIPTGAAAMKDLGAKNNFAADTTSDATVFTEDNLKRYRAVMFLNTTMNVLNADQQVAFERYIQAGGGYVGVHAATDTEYDWPWYNKLVGAYFASHPKQQNATIRVKDKNHPSTYFLPDNWERYDEWYNFKNVQSDLKVLAYLDESTYEGGEMGDEHPFAWYHEYDGGRAFYTAGGHTNESYADTLFMKHVLGGIKYAMGDSVVLDFSKSYSVKSPEDNRFTKTVLTNDLNEPMELTVTPDGRVFITERTGKLYMYDPKTNSTRLVYEFPVKAVQKYLNGLIGITLDPDFATNQFIYFFYSSSTGDKYHQNVSRFRLDANSNLDTTTEKIIIKIPIDLEVSAHTGGSLAWDNDKNLYISTGDNTVPFESDGYAPIDERKNRLVYDAQRSSANMNDLRGKILRIHPEADGSYTIPQGNLFPKGTPGTRPEIYVMGCRNPYRIAVDPITSILYWGEVGPDAGTDSRHGPRGYDEINQARAAGNYGWPYFVGNNKAYNDSNFATRAVGDLFKVAAPENHSPNNTGAQSLPAPKQAMIWYPYSNTNEFPLLGEGGRCAMAGPVYRFDKSLQSAVKLPEYYDHSLFIYDWMRNWVFAVRFDENNNYKRMEPFMQTNGDFRRPVDMEIGPDGAIYMLEYGSVYGIDNTDARLVKITYNGGNRAPVARIAAKDSIGAAPLKVQLNGDKSLDDDDDALTYEWKINGDVVSRNRKLEHSFEEKGVYQVVLKVQDEQKTADTDTLQVVAGNTTPEVKITSIDNSSFFFEYPTSFRYDVTVNDREESTVDMNRVKVSMNFIPKVAEEQKQMGHQVIDANYNLGKILVGGSDCKACHQVNAKSVGPSFMDISRKYMNDKNAVGYLANKVIQGGGGVWGEHAMSAHPQLSKEEATEMVKYVLSVINEQKEQLLPAKDAMTLEAHAGNGEQGRYIMTTSYSDNGNGVAPLTGRHTLMLRPAKVQAEFADKLYNLRSNGNLLANIKDGSYFMLKNIDLKDIRQLTFSLGSKTNGGKIEVRAGGRKGKLVSELTYKANPAATKLWELKAAVTDPGGINDLYFIFTGEHGEGKTLGAIDWVRFEGGNKVNTNQKGSTKK